MSQFTPASARSTRDDVSIRCTLAAALWLSGCIDSPDPEFSDLQPDATAVQSAEGTAPPDDGTQSEDGIRVAQFETVTEERQPTPVAVPEPTPADMESESSGSEDRVAPPAPFPSTSEASTVAPPLDEAPSNAISSDTASPNVPPTNKFTSEEAATGERPLTPPGSSEATTIEHGGLTPQDTAPVVPTDKTVPATPELEASSGTTTAKTSDSKPSLSVTGPVAPAPFPSDSLPAPSETASPAPAPAASDAITTAAPLSGELPNSEAKPLDEKKPPRPLIHISPKAALSSDAASVSQTSTTGDSIETPLPPLTSGSDTPPAAEESVTAPPASSSGPDWATDTAPPSPQTEKPATEEASESAGVPVKTVAITSPADGDDHDSLKSPPPGFSALFSAQDLSGWEVLDGKTESWQAKDGVISCIAPGGGWLQSLTTYSDFELQFEYRLSEGGNSGVSLRFPGIGNPSLVGLEIQLIDDQAEKYQNIRPEQATGSLYFAKAPKIRDAVKPAGEWNHCALRCVGNRLQVTINGQLVNDIDMSHLSTLVEGVAKPITSVRSPMGSIAFQSHPTRVDFRNVFIHDLPQAMESGVRWLDLQEGLGDPVPADSKVTVHYIGHLSSGKRFANSVEKGKPTTVLLKDVIPGWREGIPGMKVGGKRRLIVPASMAYGEKGFKSVIPPNSTLVYEIELLGYEKPTSTHGP